MRGVVRIAAAVPYVHLGNVDRNAESHLALIRQARAKHASLVVFPELSLTGATCGDLFRQQTLLEAVLRGLKAIASAMPEGITAVVGAPVAARGGVYNCAVVLSRENGVEHVQPKVYSTDGLFASGAGVAELPALQNGESTVLMGDCLIRSADGVGFGIELGSDLFAPVAPAAEKALLGADVIVNLAAMPELAGSARQLRDAVRQQSRQCLCGYVLASAGWGESSTDGVYGGHILAACCGDVLQESRAPIQEDHLLTVDIDVERIRADRLRGSFVQAAQACSKNVRALRRPCVYLPEDIAPEWHIPRMPFVPEEPQARIHRCLEVFDIQSRALARRMSITGGKAVVGVSGGLDSTLALLAAAKAADLLGLPRSNILGVTMPCFGTTDRTYQSALDLMATLGVSQREIPIHQAVRQHLQDIGHDESDHSVTYENAQARERTQVLMDLCNGFGGIVLGTGDMSEIALGWCTYNADHMSMYGVNAGVPKTLVRQVVQTVSQQPEWAECRAVLARILDTPISPELLPPDEAGGIAQQTEDVVGPYVLHDFFLYYTVRYGFAPKKVFDLAQIAFREEFAGAEILRWLKTFYRRFFTQQFKRNCSPDGVKTGCVSLSPRGDWRMPSDAQAALWLQECETL